MLGSRRLAATTAPERLTRDADAGHHGHYATNLTTNWHFNPIDLFIESALPIGSGLAFLRACGVKLGRFEIHLMQGYVAWHESGTHLGKPLNLISTYAPLSILYHALFPTLDARGIEFHETHRASRVARCGAALGLTHPSRARAAVAPSQTVSRARLAWARRASRELTTDGCRHAAQTAASARPTLSFIAQVARKSREN